MLLLNWSIPILSFLNHGAHAFLWFFIIRNTLNLLKYWIDLLDFRQWLFNFELSHWLENFWSSYHNTILCNFYSFFNNDFFFLHLALQNIVVSSISDLILFILFFSDRCHDSTWPNIIWRLILVPWIWSLCKIWVIFEVDTRRSCSYRAFWCNWFVWSLRSLPFLLQWNLFNYLWRVKLAHISIFAREDICFVQTPIKHRCSAIYGTSIRILRFNARVHRILVVTANNFKHSVQEFRVFSVYIAFWVQIYFAWCWKLRCSL